MKMASGITGLKLIVLAALLFGIGTVAAQQS